jgi:glycosyltransferase involved in cell wall biosynthesis
MKVLFISNDPLLFVEGSAVRARMSRYAEAIGELHILSRYTEDIDISDGPLTLHGRNKDKIAGWKALGKVGNELITTYGIEVVSAQDPFEYGYVALKAVEGTSAKLHIQIHTDFLSPWFTRPGIFRSPQVVMPLKNALRRKIARRVLPKAQGIRVVSERIRESLQVVYGNSIVTPEVLPIVPTHAVPDAVPLPDTTTPFTLLTIGRLEPEKRIEDILVALATIAERYPAVGLVVIGDGRERTRLESKASELGISSRVHFLGARKDAWGLMRSSQGYIQASAYEGYGITLIEAALARVPIITSDVGIVGEVLQGYEDVLVTPPGDPTNLSYHIIELLEDHASKELRIRSAEHKALEHVAKYQDLPEKIASDLARVLGV